MFYDVQDVAERLRMEPEGVLKAAKTLNPRLRADVYQGKLRALNKVSKEYLESFKSPGQLGIGCLSFKQLSYICDLRRKHSEWMTLTKLENSLRSEWYRISTYVLQALRRRCFLKGLPSTKENLQHQSVIAVKAFRAAMKLPDDNLEKLNKRQASRVISALLFDPED